MTWCSYETDQRCFLPQSAKIIICVISIMEVTYFSLLKGIEQEVTDRETVSASWVNQAEGR